ncbi:unnamed protein product, partial [Ascophyllum nodosum]
LAVSAQSPPGAELAAATTRPGSRGWCRETPTPPLPAPETAAAGQKYNRKPGPP